MEPVYQEVIGVIYGALAGGLLGWKFADLAECLTREGEKHEY